MSTVYNWNQGAERQLEWIGFEAVESDKDTGQLVVSLCLGQWFSWDKTVDGLSRIYDKLDDQDWLLKQNFTGKVSQHLIVKAGVCNYHPLWHPTALASHIAAEKQEIGSTVAYKWYIVGPWISMKSEFEEFSRNHMKQWLSLCVEFECNNLNLKVIPMDKQINKVKKDVEKNDKPKARKDIKQLLRMDKKFDAKLDKCDKMKKKPK
jgi:hypothetical protein